MSFKDDLTRINTVYCNSVSLSELDGALSELDKLLDCGLLSRENTENAEALYCRLYIKLRLSEYAETFDDGKLNETSAYIGGNYEGAESKGYKKTCAVMDGAKVLIDFLGGVSEEVAALDGEPKSVLKGLDRLKKRVENAELLSPFGAGVVFPDIKSKLLSRIDVASARAEKKLFAYLEEKTARILKAVPDKYALYEYFPLPEYDEGGGANAVIICTPFVDEARLYAVRAASDKAVYELDASAFGAAEDEIFDAFTLAEKKCGALVVFNSDKLDGSDRKILYKRAMLSGKSGLKIYIHDRNGDGAEYDECLKIADESQDMRAVDISTNYVTMPAFSDVCAEFEAKGMIDGAADSDVIKSMPYIGFIGLNKVVAAFVAGADWKKAGRKFSAEREPAAKRYLAGLKSAYLFIDSGWGDYRSGGALKEVAGEFDYDGVRGVDMENVRRIVESGHSVFAKCGMIARYCTLAGGDKSDWEKLSREETAERIALATKLVFRIMRIETTPEVELADKLDNPTAGGLCYDGGKRILYCYPSVKSNWEWTLGCIVHESFHALQAKLRKGGWSQWYYDNFGITRGRVERWAITNNIYDGNTNSDLYKVHIIEADAKAFETDCDDGRNFAWNTIDFI